MQPAESDTFAWGLACATASRDESPTKRRRTATQRFVEQEQQQQLEVGTPTKGPTRRSRTKTWPSESSSLWASRERSHGPFPLALSQTQAFTRCDATKVPAEV